ncbi:hypothetical protein [Streptomyces thermoalcalitolerans]|uniref:Integral membrane protein n=1 Tax=Streptomyces thermoalcalitolerans TaxID=65605 RepID=A0ABN1NT28_9ACTN
MPDRSLRLLTHPPQTAQGGRRGAVLLKEQPPSPPNAPADGRGDGTGGTAPDDNPFAPPPEGAPDRPWQPRYPVNGGPQGEASSHDGSDGGPNGGSDGPDQGGGGRSPWGRQWSDRQPGRSSGGFGERPQRPGGPSQGPGMRWDPTDPVQRRARYALLAGMWAFFFALFSWTYVALLLGALALYWGISSLRAKPRGHDAGTPAPTGRPQATAAISGLVTASLALAVVATSFAAQLVYRDYYTCVNDSLTQQAKQSCDRHLPPELRKVLGDKG